MSACPFSVLKNILEAERALPARPSRTEHHERTSTNLVKQKLAVQQHFRQKHPTFTNYQFRQHWEQLCRVTLPPCSIITEEDRQL